MRRLIGAAALFGVLATLPGSRAQDAEKDQDRGIDKAMGELAKDVIDITKMVKVAIRPFVGSGDAELSSSSPLLQVELGRHLAALGATVVEKGHDFELFGEYSAAEDFPDPPRQFVILKLKVVETRTGKPHALEGTVRKKKGGKEIEVQSKYHITSDPAVAQVLGLPPGGFPGDAKPKDRIDVMKKLVDRDPKDPPLLDKSDTVIRAKGQPFAIEMRVAAPKQGKHADADYKVRPFDVEGSLPRVKIERDEAYGVRVVNDAPFDAAVQVFIDGIDMFSLSEQKGADGKIVRYKYLVIPKGKSVFVRGWFVTDNDSDEFQVTEFPKSVASRFAANPAKVGTVTVNFFAAWPTKGGNPPADEPETPAKNSMSADATGRGQRFAEKYEPVEYTVGTFRGTSSVRYSK